MTFRRTLMVQKVLGADVKVMEADRSVPTYTTVAPGFLLWRPPASAEQGQGWTQRPPADKNSSSPPAPALVLLFTWLFCKPGAVSKYVQLYTSRGFPVLQVSSRLSHFLWPPSSKRFAEDVAQVMKSQFSGCDQVVVHAMSIGAYNYTTCLMLADEKPEIKTHFLGKVRGVVFDSLTIGSLDHMVQGVATGVSQWGLVRASTLFAANVYFLLSRKITVDAFNAGVEFFRNRPALVPTLIFASKNDPMSDTAALEDVVEAWMVKAVFPVTYQLWERSGHCSHLRHHGRQYEQLLGEFLDSLPKGRAECGGGGGMGGVLSKL